MLKSIKISLWGALPKQHNFLFSIVVSIFGRMNRLRNILIGVLTCLSLTVLAQQKEAEQLSYWYQNGDYEKCLKKAEKYAEVYPNQYYFPLYTALANWQFYKTTPSNATLFTSLQQLDLAYKINGRKITKYPTEQKQLHKAALQVGPTLLKEGKRDDAKQLYTYIATIFKDTTEEYTWLFPVAGGTTSITSVNATTINNTPANVVPQPSTYGSMVDKMLEFGRSFLGLPYKAAGYDPSTGFDCSGFVSYLFKQFNVDVPRSSQALSTFGTKIPLAQVRPGDLLFYGYQKNGTYRTSHVALVYSYVNGRLAFLHSSSHGVVIDDPDSASWDYWQKRFLFARRVL